MDVCCKLHANMQESLTLLISGKRSCGSRSKQGGGRNVPDISECPRNVGVLLHYYLQASESGLVWQGSSTANRPRSETRLLAGAVVDKLIGSSHGSQRTPARTYLLIQRIRVKRAWGAIGPGQTDLKIFVA